MEMKDIYRFLLACLLVGGLYLLVCEFCGYNSEVIASYWALAVITLIPSFVIVETIKSLIKK